MAPTVAEALRALLVNAIDYAGMFPPARLPFAQALSQFEEHQRESNAWILGRFIVSAADLPLLPVTMGSRVSVLSDDAVPRWVESIETKVIQRFPQPTYCEIPCCATNLLSDIQRAGAFAKIRTGGLTPDAIPTAPDVAAFLNASAKLGIPFKATAGLHHPIRAMHAGAMMHGFINVLLGSAFAWHGAPAEVVEEVLNETDPGAFAFDEQARWRDRVLSREQISDARRRFAHGFGSCSFAEPVEGLQAIGWLP